MTQNIKITLGNISANVTEERVFDSKNKAFMWINHQLVRLSRCSSCHELYFRVESYNSSRPDSQSGFLPF